MSNETVQIAIRIDKAKRDELKKRVIDDDTTVTELLIKWIDEYLNNTK